MKEQSENTRALGRKRNPAVDQEIHKAALELFIDHGIEAANFERVSERSGVSRATIYRRWNDKEEMLASAIRNIRQPPGADPEAIERMSPRQLVLLLQNAMTNSLNQTASQSLFARLVGSIPDHPRLMTIYREQFVDPTWKAITEAVDRARLHGAFPNSPPKELLRDLLSGAIMHRTLMRNTKVLPNEERIWVRKLLRQLGLTDVARKPSHRSRAR